MNIEHQTSDMGPLTYVSTQCHFDELFSLFFFLQKPQQNNIMEPPLTTPSCFHMVQSLFSFVQTQLDVFSSVIFFRNETNHEAGERPCCGRIAQKTLWLVTHLKYVFSSVFIHVFTLSLLQTILMTTVTEEVDDMSSQQVCLFQENNTPSSVCRHSAYVHQSRHWIMNIHVLTNLSITTRLVCPFFFCKHEVSQQTESKLVQSSFVCHGWICGFELEIYCSHSKSTSESIRIGCVWNGVWDEFVSHHSVSRVR